jgi:hypothetical protein
MAELFKLFEHRRELMAQMMCSLRKAWRFESTWKAYRKLALQYHPDKQRNEKDKVALTLEIGSVC